MGGRIAVTFLALAAILGAFTTTGSSAELVMDTLSAELAAMNSRMAAIEAQMQAVRAGGGAAYDCGCADGACEGVCCDYGWYAGGGAYFLVPHWTSNPAYARAVAVGGVAEATQTDFNYGLSAAPLIWLGYRGPSGLGFEARGWWLDDAESIAFTNPGGIAINSATPLGLRNTSTTAGDDLLLASSLEMAVVDMLGTYQARLGLGTLELGAGIRYARIDQQYRHVEDPAANDLLDIVNSTHRFEGAGPTIALRGRAPITAQLTALADLRYSVLFGDFDQRAVSVADNVVVADRTYSTDDFLSVAEIELGGEYLLPRDRVDFFVDGTFVAQVWLGAGNAANSDIITVLVDPETADKNADLALIGFRLSGGVRF